MKTKENTLDKHPSCLKVFNVFAFLMKWSHLGHRNEKEINGFYYFPSFSSGQLLFSSMIRTRGILGYYRDLSRFIDVLDSIFSNFSP